MATRAEDYRDGDPEEDFYARYGGRSLHRQSHGESFLHLIQGDFRPGGAVPAGRAGGRLVPPEAADPPVRAAPAVPGGAQFILAAHAPILTGLPGAALLSMDGGAMHPVAYEDTESYRVTEMFINRRESLLRLLLED